MKNTSKGIPNLALGLLIGSIVGIATDNIGLWMSLGIVLGAALNQMRNKVKAENQGDN